MEYLLVNFRDERDVVLDGEVGGLTNHLIALSPGTVTISLGEPFDFLPTELTVVVKGTSVLAPFEVTFE